MGRPNSKNAILDAVEQIVIERGAAHVTLDAVAQQCEISKGGLMYNFPTKEALIQAMLARLIARHEELQEVVRQQLGPEANELMVEVVSTLAMPERGIRVHAGLLAAIANEPSLLGEIRERFQARFQEITSCSPRFDDAALTFFAAFGLHFHDMMNLALVPPEQREHLRQILLSKAADAPLGGAETQTDENQREKAAQNGSSK